MGRTVTGAPGVPLKQADIATERWRKDTGRHANRLHERPNPPRHNAASSSPSSPGSLTAIFLTALLVGGYVAEARQHIISAPAPSPGRGRKGSGRDAAQSGSGEAGLFGKSVTINPLREISGVTTGPVSLHEKKAANAPVAQVHSRSDRRKRIIPVPNQIELKGDLPLDRRSLIGARVLAMRSLLGSAAANKEDEQLLEIANRVHLHAVENPMNHQASDAAAMLLREEARQWAAENGANIMGVGEEDAIEVFLDEWNLALNPPPAPSFKSHTQVVEELPPDVHETEIDVLSAKKYFQQFHDYIQNHLKRFCAAKTMEVAAAAGLGRFVLEHRPSQVWLIDEITFRKDWVSHKELLSGTRLRLKEKIDLAMPAIILPLPGGDYGFISPGGDFQHFPPEAVEKNGKIKKYAILRAFRKDAVKNYRKGTRQYGLLTSSKLRSRHYKIKVRQIELNKKSGTLKNLIEKKLETDIKHDIILWKKQNYNKELFYTIVDNIIPFFEMVRISGLDPGYSPKIQDVLMEFLELGMMFVLAGGSKLYRMGYRVSFSLKGAGSSIRGSNALRTALQGGKTSAYLIEAGGELTKFVPPNFTARKLAMASAQSRFPALKETLLHALRHSDQIVKAQHKSDEVLDSIYTSIAKNWWKGKIKPETIKAEIDARAAESIPDVLFRGQKGNDIVSSWGTVKADQLDDYLATIIKHSARAGGSAGETFSLTTDKSVALRFIRDKDKGSVLAIRTEADRAHFRTIENIIKNDGPRLVKEQKITSGTLAAAIRYALDEGEREIFYIGGTIPRAWISLA